MRLVVYRFNHSIKADGTNLSGNFIMSLKSIFSNVECSLRNNSFTKLRFFISMSILITSEKFFDNRGEIRSVSPIYSIDAYE